jgi:hypothetical protein
VLGLYKMSGASGRAFAIRTRGALADMVLWAIFRLQTRVFASKTYDRRVLLPATAAVRICKLSADSERQQGLQCSYAQIMLRHHALV